MNKTILTVAGLMLVGSPVFAQTTTPSVSVTTPGITSGMTTGENGGQLKTTLTNAGVTDLNQVNGMALTGKTSSGLPVMVIVGPKDLKTTSAMNVNREDVLKALKQAGLQDVNAANGAQMFRGMTDDHDNDKEAVLAISGVNLAANGSVNGSLNTSEFDKGLQNAGIKSEAKFNGKLARATTSNGQTIYMIVGDNDLMAQTGDKSFNFDDKAVRQSFDKGGLTNLKVLDNVHLVQGMMNDHTVFAITGTGLQG